MLVVQHGRTQKTIKLDFVSNGEFTLDEFLVYKSACEKHKIELPLKSKAARHAVAMQKLLKGQFDQE